MPENLPTETQSDISNILQFVHLPQFLLGPTGHAISHLVGLGIGYLNAHVEGMVEDIKTETAARRVVRLGVAEAAARAAASDPEIVERGLDRWLGHGLKKQRNREAVAIEAVTLLDVPSIEQRQPVPTPEPENIDEDWLNVFGQYAENASSAQMQQFWGRVLAGQIRTGHSVSLRTLRILSELDHRLATLIDKYADYIINMDAVLPPAPDSRETKFEMQQLHDAGLFTGGYGSTPSAFKRGSEQVVWSTNFGVLLIDMETENEGQGKFELPRFFSYSKMTSAGTEIFKLSSKKFALEPLLQIAESLPKQGVKKIAWMPYASNATDIPKSEISLWAPES